MSVISAFLIMLGLFFLGESIQRGAKNIADAIIEIERGTEAKEQV